MFFSNMEELGQDFFESQTDSFRALSWEEVTPDNLNDSRLHRFGFMVKYVLYPDLLEVNPHRQVDEALSYFDISHQYNVYPHTDLNTPGIMTFINLGVNRNGQTSGPYFTKDNGPYGAKISDLDDDTIATNFYKPPQYYAAAFDPNMHYHVSPAPDNSNPRSLIRANIRTIDWNSAVDHSLIMPVSDRYLSPELVSTR
jgi:hypothetical protein